MLMTSRLVSVTVSNFHMLTVVYRLCVDISINTLGQVALRPPDSSLVKMSKQQALSIPAEDANFTLTTTTIYEPGQGEILVKIFATGLNPMDWKLQKYSRVVPIPKY